MTSTWLPVPSTCSISVLQTPSVRVIPTRYSNAREGKRKEQDRLECSEDPFPGHDRARREERAMTDEREHDEPLFGVEAVAARLGVQPTTVHRWCREGRLACLKPGKSWRVRASSLETF